MKKILQQLLANTLEKIMEYYEAAGLKEIYVMTEEFKSITDDMAREILSVFIANADIALCEEAKAQRKADGFTIKERGVSRSLYTILGDFSYTRTHFKASGGGYAHILDNILGTTAYERVDAGVGARMVNMSSVVSFAKSAAITTGGKVSRMTAWNRMRDVGEVAFVPPRQIQTPKTIHIFADEDHVNLNDGKNTIMPLVTYCAGKEPVCKGRNALKDPVHIQGYGLKPDKHWEYVYAVMAEQYEMKEVRQIFIYGDGAKWIKAGLDVFPDAIYVLDEYHLEKRLRSMLSGDICCVFARRLRSAVKSGNREAFQKLFYEMTDAVSKGMKDDKGRQKKHKVLHENAAFLLAHWQAILNAKHPDAIGSCTEALVSHILSERLSRDPMGWSRHGLSKLAMVRVFRINGGEVSPLDIGKGKTAGKERTVINGINKYEDIIMKHHNEVFAGRRDWKWFEPSEKDLISAKRTGTKHALDALGKMRNVC